MTVRVAAVNWRLRSIRSDGAFWNHAYEFIEKANDDGAQLVVLPELFSLELLYLEPKLGEAKCPRYLAQYWEDMVKWLARMSVNSGMAIVGGSHFSGTDDGIKNICPIAFPDGQVFFQEKNKLTVYERSDWGILAGHGVQPLPGRLGVSVCYDCEFPEGPRCLAEDGMLIHAVPAWTETRRGFQRVRWSSLARAIENQVFVVHSSLVGDIGREPIPESYGSSAIIAPSIAPFPMEAVLSESKLNEDDIIVAGLDIDALFASRNEGEVTNWQDRDASSWELLKKPNGFAPWVI
ncbi:MAG: nitrilase-related carbon-nitrogen hydrolase [Armatimonadota bacterium]